MSRASDDAGKIYDGMTPEQQDMPRDQFIREVCALTSQKNIKKDLDKIMKHKRDMRNRRILGEATKKAIDATGAV